MDGLSAPTNEDELELAYTRAFAAAREGYDLAGAGKNEEASRAFARALDFVEAKLAQAEEAGHARLKELRDRLDADLAALQGAKR